MIEFLIDGPKTAAKTFLFAHGAGAPMDSAFMQRIAEGVAAPGIRVIRFEFPYMQRRRETGKRGAPDPPRVLMQSYRDAIDQAGGGSKLVIGGKSLGGRLASMVADDLQRFRLAICQHQHIGDGARRHAAESAADHVQRDTDG